MAQYLKINSQVLNADTIIAAAPFGTNQIAIVTTSTKFSTANEVQYNYWLVFGLTSAAEVSACIADINKALTDKPGGRVVEVAKSSAYTITQIGYQADA